MGIIKTRIEKNENSDNMWKYLVSNRKQDGVISRIYKKESVSLFCSIKEGGPDDDENKAFWDARFYIEGHTDNPIRLVGSWDKMVDKFEELVLEGKSAQTELDF